MNISDHLNQEQASVYSTMWLEERINVIPHFAMITWGNFLLNICTEPTWYTLLNFFRLHNLKAKINLCTLILKVLEGFLDLLH